MNKYSVRLVKGHSEIIKNGLPWHRDTIAPENVFIYFEYALREGNLNSIQRLDDIFPEGTYKILILKNILKQTLFHLLSITGGYSEDRRVEIAEWIFTRSLDKIGESALNSFQVKDFNSKDFQKRTPLHYAARFRRKSLLLWFLQKDLFQSIFEEDDDKMTPFHYLITTKRIDVVLTVKTIWEAALEKSYVFQGSPPLHLAAKSSSVEMLELLIDTCGFSPDAYDVNGYTALHNAIKYSDESSKTTSSRILYLLKKTSPDQYYTENTRNSPLHIAAMFGKSKILEFLFNVYKDSTTGELSVETGDCRISANNNLEITCHESWKTHLLFMSSLNSVGQTCLHVIPNQTVSQGSVECVKLILNHPDLTYRRERERFCLQKDHDFHRVLQIAAEYETVEICQEILKSLRHDASAEWLRRDILLPIYQKIPDALLPVYENCVKPRNDFSRREELVTMDFAPIVGERRHLGNGQPTMGVFPETYYLQQVNSLSSKIKNKIFSSPLVETFIAQKLKCLRGFIIMGFIFHLLYISMFMFLAYTVKECPLETRNKSTTTNISSTDNPANITENELTWEICDPLEYSEAGTTISILTIVFAILFATKEFYQFCRNPRNHFKKPSNVFQLVFSIVTFYCIISLLLIDTSNVIPYKLLRMLAATIVLLGVALSFHQLKKLNWFPSFLRIFFQVARRSAVLLTYYSLLIVAFTVVFKILSPQNDDYNGLRGIVKVLAMMVGEFEFEGNFKLPTNNTTHDSFLTVFKLVVFALFIFIAAIVGLNLLIGLAVEDIQTLKNDAQWEVVSCQLDQLFMMEQFLLSLQPILPSKMYSCISNQINLVVNSKRIRPDGYYSTEFDFPVVDNA